MRAGFQGRTTGTGSSQDQDSPRASHGSKFACCRSTIFPKPVPVRRPELQLHAQLFKLSPLPVLAAVAGSLALNIEVNAEWFPGLGIATIGVARFGQKLLAYSILFLWGLPSTQSKT